MRFILASCLYILLLNLSFGQNNDREPITYTLQECISIALKNNIDLKTARNNAQIAVSNLKQSKFDFGPNVSAQWDYNWSNGLGFDNTTNAPIRVASQSSTPGVFLSQNIFDGLDNLNTLKRNENLKNASLLDIELAVDNVTIFINQLYLEVLLGTENLKISQQRLDLLRKQLERARKRVDLGVDNAQEVYNLESQIANENLNYVNLDNTLKQSKLSLLQLMQVDITAQGIYNFEEIEIENSELEEELQPFNEIKNASSTYWPALKSAEYRIKASENDIKIAQAGRMPSLDLNAGFQSRFFSASDVPEEFQVAYFDQLGDNDSRFVGLSLNIPIFNRLRVSNSISVAKINLENTKLQLEQAELDFNNALQQAYLDLIAARSTFLAAQENLEAVEKAYEFAEASYNSGRLDFYSYLESLNNKNRAEIELANSKYRFVLRKNILEIYQGL